MTCRYCGYEHDAWIRCEVAARRRVANVTEIVANTSEVANTVTMTMANAVAEKVDREIASTYKYRDAEKRRAYQREFMRKDRARKRAKADAASVKSGAAH